MYDETSNEMMGIEAAIAAAEARVIDQTGVLAMAETNQDATLQTALLASYQTSLHLLHMIKSQNVTDAETTA